MLDSARSTCARRQARWSSSRRHWRGGTVRPSLERMRDRRPKTVALETWKLSHEDAFWVDRVSVFNSALLGPEAALVQRGGWRTVLAVWEGNHPGGGEPSDMW